MRGIPGARFWAKVDRNSECWLWAGATLPRGYGRFWDGERLVYSHVYSFLLHGGTLEEGQEVLHSCDNPPCCNPAHLRAGTRRENMQDARERGRLKGNQIPVGRKRTNLLPSDIRAIRASNEPRRVLAERYGLTLASIHNILVRKTWKHVE